MTEPNKFCPNALHESRNLLHRAVGCNSDQPPHLLEHGGCFSYGLPYLGVLARCIILLKAHIDPNCETPKPQTLNPHESAASEVIILNNFQQMTLNSKPQGVECRIPCWSEGVESTQVQALQDSKVYGSFRKWGTLI